MTASPGRLTQSRVGRDRRGDRAGPAGRASVAMHFVRMVVDYAAARGMPAQRLLAGAGLAERYALDDEDARMAFGHFSRLCDHAAEALAEPYLGLRVGQSVKPGHLGSEGVVLMSCATVREMVERSARYSTLVFDACRNEFVERGRECIRYWHSNLPGGASPGRLQDEMNMALWITLGRWLMGRPDLDPLWVSFRHARPPDTREYEALFRCLLRFDTGETALAFDARYLDLPLPQANSAVRRVMDALCEQSLARLGTVFDPPWLAACRAAILRAFERGVPTLPLIAAAIDLTPGQLRACLTRRGVTFRRLVDDLRHQLALGYVRDPTFTLVEIASLLGFSEQSAFQRAFKRRAGITPGRFRRSARDGSGSAS